MDDEKNLELRILYLESVVEDLQEKVRKLQRKNFDFFNDSYGDEYYSGYDGAD